MAGDRRRLIVGNWKMNGLTAALREAEALAEALRRSGAEIEVVLCPPATILAQMSAALRGSGVLTGGQDCHKDAGGAHTGDISAAMLADAGAVYVIVGHSERRSDHGEDDALVAQKAATARTAGLVPIICVGETEGERRAGRAEEVVRRQLAGSIPGAIDPKDCAIAYEPVWAIGTGLTPTEGDIETMHRTMRSTLAARFGAAAGGMRLLYGGSVKPGNAAAILALDDVDGALVGGASLLAKDFLAIISAA